MKTLYEPCFEHDNCGIGAVVNIDGEKSYDVVQKALTIVEKLEHRAGKDAEGETGDGVGILVQLPHAYLKEAVKKEGLSFDVGDERDYGVGMCFFSDAVGTTENANAKICFEKCVKDAGVKFLGWRQVPVNADVLGSKAFECMPDIQQAFVERPADVERGLDFDKILYKIRLAFEKHGTDTYVCSFSSRTIVYKGMFLVNQLRTFYADLQNEAFVSSLAIVHSRFSTNTQPSWKRAHPNRFIAHNGEINTIRGNVDRMLARNGEVDVNGSDSSMLDNTLEYMVMNGMPLPLAVMVCLPEPWKHDEAMSVEKKNFYHYWATMMEPWDGPAAIIFSDGDVLGATLDRNGLRPSRWLVTKDNLLVISSEVGVLDIDEKVIVKKSRLMPGRMILVDVNKKCFIDDSAIKAKFATEHPYGEWLWQHIVHLSDLKIPNKKIPTNTESERQHIYRAFGWNNEDIQEMILPMAKNGHEPIGAMGVDSPLACMSDKHPPLYSYFKQLFAQVTNPPIDSIREKIVTDTTVYVGSDGDILEAKGSNCNVLEINNPILTCVDLLKIENLNQRGLRAKKISLLFEKEKKLEAALENIFVQIDECYGSGFNILILSDRGVDKQHLAIPSLLAVSAVEQYLVRTKKRTVISIILESAEVRNVHQAAMCLGYGARAVNPYLAHETIAELIDKKILDKDYHTAVEDFNKALLDGIVKIAAKMGISALQSYQSAQIFEAVGISKKVIDKYFTNTVSRIEGITLKEIEEDVLYHHHKAWCKDEFAPNERLDNVGYHKLKRGKDAEDHLYNPQTIAALQDSTRNGDYAKFKEYTSLVDDNAYPHTLRAMLDFAYDKVKAISIDDVESVESIVRRFKTGAMSYGSISEEAHKCLALAMNRLHGKSNSGEGGENPERLGTEYNSAIKQVASARFGVTEEYLLSAEELQIKMAQGAKPGEGGHLPGKKVYPWIAKTRHATPGVSLISPPPHHDIYSIEDIAQLIFDLKNANRQAKISVKLASEAGVGTVAAGVAKAGAQLILISGHDGGTGAAPLSSIHHAGLPWELGLAEAHQTLLQNGLRGRVRLETDGKLMSGRDVVIACLLGAEEFGFATAPLITLGCDMLRVCNLDTCPFGIATQNKTLREKFSGKAEYVENFMIFVAREIREYLAKLGMKSVDDMVGRVDLLKLKSKHGFKRAALIDLSRVIQKCSSESWKQDRTVFDFALEKSADVVKLLPVFEKNCHIGTKSILLGDIKISSTDRTFGTILGSEIQKKYGKDTTLKEDSFVVNVTGGAGQSFGAFIPKGLTLNLLGEANDYLGKGLSGGKITVRKQNSFKGESDKNVIIGNVALFGATSGKAFVNGIAGERFCVRNSGAVAVVEGCGDHALEYMTGGVVVVLGDTGRNFAAGMSGGVAYVYDVKHNLYKNLNGDFVKMYDLTDEISTWHKKTDDEFLKELIEEHVKCTCSEKAAQILADWDECKVHFKKVIPDDYLRMKNEFYAALEKGMSTEEAEMQAFNIITGQL